MTKHIQWVADRLMAASDEAKFHVAYDRMEKAYGDGIVGAALELCMQSDALGAANVRAWIIRAILGWRHS
jgi:hypothetical protein